jgi:hypothetical protein
VRVFLAERMPPERLAVLLAEARDAAERDHDRLAGVVARLETVPGARFPRLTALHGLRAVEAAWPGSTTSRRPSPTPSCRRPCHD